jgi:hypothetical protein
MKARSARRQRKQVFTRALMAKDPSRGQDALQPAPNRAGAKRQVALSSTMTESLDRSPRSLREMPTGFAGGRPQPRAAIPPEVLEPVRRQRRVDRSILGLLTGVGGRRAASSDLRACGINQDVDRHLFCRCEAAKCAARQLFGVMDAVFCKLHYSVHDQIEVAWICGADYLPHVLEGRAHVRCELRNDLFSAHYPAPI